MSIERRSGKSLTTRRTKGRHRSPRRGTGTPLWLGAGAVTVGVGAALASASGIAHADSDGSSSPRPSGHADKHPCSIDHSSSSGGPSSTTPLSHATIGIGGAKAELTSEPATTRPPGMDALPALSMRQPAPKSVMHSRSPATASLTAQSDGASATPLSDNITPMATENSAVTQAKTPAPVILETAPTPNAAAATPAPATGAHATARTAVATTLASADGGIAGTTAPVAPPQTPLLFTALAWIRREFDSAASVRTAAMSKTTGLSVSTSSPAAVTPSAGAFATVPAMGSFKPHLTTSLRAPINAEPAPTTLTSSVPGPLAYPAAAAGSMTIGQFVATYTGHTVADPVGTAIQCVALVKAFLYYVDGVPAGAWGNADQYVPGQVGGNGMTAAGFHFYTDQNFQNGDILVYGDHTLGDGGHIGIYDNQQLFDQNSGFHAAPVTAAQAGFSPLSGVAAYNGYLGYWRRGISDGTYIKVTGADPVYRVAGGAPIYVSSWNNVGGSQPVTTISQSQFNALRSQPADGTYLRNAAGTVFVVAGGAPLGISNGKYLDSGKPIINIDQAAIDNAGGSGVWSHLGVTPADGSYLRNPVTGGVYVVAGGTLLGISAPKYLVSGKPIVNVDPGVFANGAAWSSHFTTQPNDGTYLRNPDTGSVYVVAGGALLGISNSNYLVSGKTLVNVDPGVFANGAAWNSHFTTQPNNGTYLRDAATGDLYVVAGGAPIAVSTWDSIGGPTGKLAVTVDPLVISNAANWNNLSYYPADGTYLRGFGTGKFYRVSGGVPKEVASAPSGYVNVDQAAIDNAGTGGIWNHLKGAAVSPSNPPGNEQGEAAQEKFAADFNTSLGWIPVLGTIYNGVHLVMDFLDFTVAVVGADGADMADELGDMTIDVIGMVPIVGGPIAGSLYWALHPAGTATNTTAT